jgi:hypothetical protein
MALVLNLHQVAQLRELEMRHLLLKVVNIDYAGAAHYFRALWQRSSAPMLENSL